MPLSILDLFTIGIGPSSSHSVGPMRAARAFVDELDQRGLLGCVSRIAVRLFGSLALTGVGHGSDRAVLLGLMGHTPEEVDVDAIPELVQAVRDDQRLTLPGGHAIGFHESDDVVFDRQARPPHHPNTLRLTAYDQSGAELDCRAYCSIGGGFIMPEQELAQPRRQQDEADNRRYPFRDGASLDAFCQESNQSISQVVLANERLLHSEETLHREVLARWRVMQEAVQRGQCTEGVLPGGLQVSRRAPELSRRLLEQEAAGAQDPLAPLDWVNVFALAVSEENAAGGRVVTAPTNGAAGILPAVLHYYMKFCPRASEQSLVPFFLTAGAIGMLYKESASISGAEVGCQGEVGVACSMAAGALTEVLGGAPAQAFQAAEIAMEHHLGLTCDPVGGLVQVPCIERNAVASVSAINASRLALAGDGSHRVSLDKVIATMRETGADMSDKYKETAQGGLAMQLNVVQC